MPAKKPTDDGPPKSPGGRFAKKGREHKRRRSGGGKLPINLGGKGKRGSRIAGEAERARHDEQKPAKKAMISAQQAVPSFPEWLPSSSVGLRPMNTIVLFNT